MTILYRVGFDRTTDPRIEVTAEVGPASADHLDLVLPSWVPGSYHIIDYAKNLLSLRATDGPGGAPLPIERVAKDRWRISTLGAASVSVRYSVYAHGLITEGVDLTAEHLFLNPALALPYVDGRAAEPCEVEFHLPPGWRAFAELPEVQHAPPRFRAKDYDELVDSPIDCGTPVELGFHAAGVPHRILLCGAGGNYEAHRLETDLARLVEATARLFGELPVDHYTFFYHLTDEPDGGLEHARSNSAVILRTTFRPESAYQRFLDLSSHEYFHLFNVKRILPARLVPFDYTREVYTRLLWAMEGTTDYYGLLLLRRSGLLPPSRYLEELAKLARTYLHTPGRRARSLEDASYLAWIDFYQPHEDLANRTVSYYLKGHLVSWALDLEIRQSSANRASLDDVIRALWNEFGRPRRGVGEGDLPAVARRATGIDLTGFFARYVAGVDELDLATYARYAGLELAPKRRPPEAGDDPEPGDLGIEYVERHGLVGISRVLDGGPGRRAGLVPGDDIVAIDRVRVSHAEFPKALARAPAGTRLTLTLFRRGYLTDVEVETGPALAEKFAFTPVAAPTDLERSIYASWLEAKWVDRAAAAPPD